MEKGQTGFKKTARKRGDAMIETLSFIPPRFISDLTNGMVVNFQIASLTLLVSLCLGGFLTFISLVSRIVAVPITFFITLIRAMPTFLVMICILYIVPKQINIAGSSWSLSNSLIVVLSLLPYGVAYVFDNLSESIRQWRRGQLITALQLLPNLSRMYFILIMSSAAGAAIGVTEGVTTLLRYATRLESVPQRLMLFAIGIFFFGAVMQTGFALINRLREFMIARVSKRTAS